MEPDQFGNAVRAGDALAAAVVVLVDGAVLALLLGSLALAAVLAPLDDGAAPEGALDAVGVLEEGAVDGAVLGRVSYIRSQTRIAANTTPARYVTASLS